MNELIICKCKEENYCGVEGWGEVPKCWLCGVELDKTTAEEVEPWVGFALDTRRLEPQLTN